MESASFRKEKKNISLNFSMHNQIMKIFMTCSVIVFQNSSKKNFLRTVFENFSLTFYRTKVV